MTRNLLMRLNDSFAVKRIIGDIHGRLFNPAYPYYMPHSEIWLPTVMNIRSFYNWRQNAYSNPMMIENSPQWLDKITQLIEKPYRLAMREKFENIRSESNYDAIMINLLSVSQVYSYCVIKGIIPTINHGPLSAQPDFSKSFSSERIYAILSGVLVNSEHMDT